MARRTPRPMAEHEKTLYPLREVCEACGQPLWVAYLRIADQERLKALLQQQGHVIWRLMACSPMWDTRVHRTRA